MNKTPCYGKIECALKLSSTIHNDVYWILASSGYHYFIKFTVILSKYVYLLNDT
jgi:hypothetical protein